MIRLLIQGLWNLKSSLHSCLIKLNIFNISFYNSRNLKDKLIDWSIDWKLLCVFCNVYAKVWTSNVMLLSLNNFQSLHKYLSKYNQRVTCDLLAFFFYITHIILMANIRFYPTQIVMLQHMWIWNQKSIYIRKSINTIIALVTFS